MIPKVLSLSPDYVNAFVKTCFHQGLDPETTTILLETAQSNDLHTNSPDFQEGFSQTLTKHAGFFARIGKGLDWAGKGLLRGGGAIGKGLAGMPAKGKYGVLSAPDGFGKLQQLTTAARLPASVAGGGLGVSYLHQKHSDLDALNSFPEMGGSANSPSASGVTDGSGPFDYLHTINGRGSGAAPAGSSGFTTQLKGLQDQASKLKAMTGAGYEGTASLQAMQQLKQVNQRISSMQDAHQRVLPALDRLIPQHTQAFQEATGPHSWLSNLFHGGEAGWQRKAQESATMLDRLKATRQQALSNANASA